MHLRELKNCKTSARRSVVTPSPCGKNYFLQNKLPAASGHNERVRKKVLFAKQRSITISPAKCYMHTLAVGGDPEWNRRDARRRQSFLLRACLPYWSVRSIFAGGPGILGVTLLE